jgi:anaerobic selenocysteine-containing dehydrogenase
MGFDEPCFAESDEEILRAFLTAQTDPAFAGLTWERLLEEGFARFELPSPYLPFARGGFPTASGRCELRSTALERDGYDPLPTFVEEATPAQEGELHVISPPAHSFLNSTFANLERFVRREKGPRVLLHPEDAGARGIVDGAAVRVSNALGSVVVQAVVTPDVVRGTAVAPSVWWNKLGGDGRSINQLTPQDEADMGSGALFYDVRARVEPVIE